MESPYGAMSVEAVLFVIGMILLVGLLGLLYWGFWNARKLDRQIQRGDPALLTTSSYKREEVIQAPQGSVIMEGQIVQIPGQYVQPIPVQHTQLHE
jgi:ABC-type phosphate transport system auxiliary subunit